MSEAIALENSVAVSPAEAGPSFDTFPLSQETKAAAAQQGWVTPSVLQAAVVEPAMSGRDLMVRSPVNGGAASAFALPLVERLASGCGKPSEPAALVLVPTREMAQQTAVQVRAIGASKALRVQAVYGGAPVGRQSITLKSGVDVVVGTPGRLLDHVRRRNLSFASVRVVIIDQADEVLAMGFWQEVVEIVGMAPAERQVLLFSPSFPVDILSSARTLLREPLLLEVAGEPLSAQGASHAYYTAAAEQPRPRQLLALLEVERPEAALVVCNNRSEAGAVGTFLREAGLRAEAVTPSLRSRDCERLNERLRSRDLQVVVTTDAALRGVDASTLSHIVNYALPVESAAYLHRVGRFGNGGKQGMAVTLVDQPACTSLPQLEAELGVRFAQKNLPSEEEVIRVRSERIMKELAEKASVAEVAQQLPVAQQLVSSPEAVQVIAYLLKSYFNAQTADAEHRGQPRPAVRQGRPENGDNGADVMDGGRGRRRRRRRGRGRGDRPQDATTPFYDTMDASEALASEGAPAESGAPVSTPSAEVSPSSAPSSSESTPSPIAVVAEVPCADGLTRIRVNIGFDDGFKGRGAVAKRIAALAGLNEGSVTEVESRREYSVLKALPHIAELVVDRVDGTPIGKKILSVSLAQ
jgi:ATP-dependent RNA helicase DeaD